MNSPECVRRVHCGCFSPSSLAPPPPSSRLSPRRNRHTMCTTPSRPTLPLAHLVLPAPSPRPSALLRDAFPHPSLRPHWGFTSLRASPVPPAPPRSPFPAARRPPADGATSDALCRRRRVVVAGRRFHSAAQSVSARSPARFARRDPSSSPLVVEKRRGPKLWAERRAILSGGMTS